MADKKGTLLPAYLVVGADEYKSALAVTRLKAHLDQGFAAFNLAEFEASSSLEPGNFINTLNTLPVGDSRRIVILKGAEHLPKTLSEAIISYLKSGPNMACTLCLVAKSLAKSTRLYKAVAAIGPHAIIDCAPRKPWQLAGDLVTQAHRKYKISMDEAAAKELVSRLGDSRMLLEQQLATLSDICRNKGIITTDDVERNVARVAEVKPWDMLDAISSRNTAKALALYQLMDNPSQIALVALIVRRLTDLICARSLAARGEAAMLAQTLGRRDWQVRGYVGWAKGFGPGELEKDLLKCRTCDRKLKSGAEPDIAFTKLILAICGND